MRTILILLSSTVLMAQAPESKPMTDDEKTIYALGLSIHNSLNQFDLSPAEMEVVKRALTDAAANKPAVDLAVWGPKIATLGKARAAHLAEGEKKSSAAYLTKAAAEAGAVKSDTGLIFRETKPGMGESPKATDTVKV